MNNINTIRACTTFTDESGRRCIRVPLANSPLSAVLLADDFDHLAADGLSCNWALNHSTKGGPAYVCVKVPGANTITVARFIARARWKEAVRYRSGNRLDLRPENLYVTKGGRAHKDCGTLMQRAEPQEVAG